MKKLTITTSWDDGDVLDERLAELLTRYGVKGTFYVTRHYRPERISEGGIRSLACFHEVGAHTLTHADLRTLSRAKKEEEIEGSKRWLEHVLNKKVQMFCYPAGHFNAEAKEVVRKAGYKGARTTKFGVLTSAADPFEMPTTLAVYPMPLRKLDARAYYWGKLLQPFFERAPGLHALGVPLSAFRSFGTLACSVFDIALQKGGVFHLWGHSWEIEKYGMWGELEDVLRYVNNRPNCQYVTNGELV